MNSIATLSTRLSVRSMAEISPRRIEWLWPGRIPIGKVSLLCGDPGLGKSLVTLDIAARISSGGEWPDIPTPVEQGGVLLLTAEDDAADTVAPRLASLGADLARVQIADGVDLAGSNQRKFFSLGKHLDDLDRALKEIPGARLVVIDPVTAYLDGIHESRGSVVRRMLRGLTEIALSRNVAVVAVTHLSKKGSGPATLRALDSLAFAAAARSVWLISADPVEPKRRLMTPAKTNLAAGIGGLAFEIETAQDQPRIAWKAGRIEIAADDLVRLSREPLRELAQRIELTPREEVAAWLHEQLIDGPWVRKDLWTEARGMGFARRTVYRALHEIGAVVVNDGREGKYVLLAEQAAGLPKEDLFRSLSLKTMAEERVAKWAKRRSAGGAAVASTG